MRTFWVKSWFSVLVLLLAAMCFVLPVTAASGTVTITLRGLGVYSLGDTIIFDGTNTVSNTTLLKITGPGLASGGVPLYDLSGTSGTGNTVKVDATGKWTFRWDTPSDTSMLQSARYTITAYDFTDSTKASSISVIMQKPQYYISISQPSIHMADYIQIQGMTEQGIDYIKLNITDSSGTVYHTYMAPVSPQGSFQYSFHVDMQPGQYSVIGTNPSLKNNLALVFSVTSVQTSNATTPAPTSEKTEAITLLPTTVSTQPVQSPQPIATKTNIAMTTIVLSVIIFVAVAILKNEHKRK